MDKQGTEDFTNFKSLFIFVFFPFKCNKSQEKC